MELIGESLTSVARDRGHAELLEFLERLIYERYHIQPAGTEIAAAIRDQDLPRLRGIIEVKPDLVDAADERGNQPVHWAGLTREIDVIDYLLTRGADIGAQRPDGARPMDLTNGDYHYRSWYRDLPPTGLPNPTKGSCFFYWRAEPPAHPDTSPHAQPLHRVHAT